MRPSPATPPPYDEPIGISQLGSSPPRLVVRGPAGMAGGVLVAVYAWWATGLTPFTLPSDVAIAIPVVALAVAACLVPPRSARAARPTTTRPAYAALPWIAFLLVAVGLECAALALGGRSTTFPTVSTVVDHALAWHGVRFVLFLAWLVVGWAPVARPALLARRPGR